MNKWYLHAGEQGDVVMSTRIRLARNVTAYPFPARLDREMRKELNEQVKDILFTDKKNAYTYIDMETLAPAQAVSMAERHLISPEFASERDGRALLLSEDESVSVMLCEEDHVRLQVMRAGLELEAAYRQADELDTLLDKGLGFAFDESLGYLTSCPTNLGTGMRASVMLHLPALTRCGQISRLASTVSKLGLTIRGAYGEGSSPTGAFYQLSNQVTLGISEKAALENLKSITMQVVAQERTARETLREDEAFADEVWRAYGTLKYARLLTSNEFMERISLVRLGAALEIVPVSLDTVSELLASMQAATINAAQGRALEPRERDRLRAQAVREQV